MEAKETELDVGNVEMEETEARETAMEPGTTEMETAEETERAQHTKDSQKRQWAHLRTDRNDADDHDDKVQPIPQRAKVSLRANARIVRDQLYQHFKSKRKREDVIEQPQGIRNAGGGIQHWRINCERNG